LAELLTDYATLDNPKVDVMPTLQQQIQKNFLAQLAALGVVDAARVDALRQLMDSGKLKVDDIVKLFSPGDDIK
jgi:anti-sigma28 factor (negative regulator of flagellin synthesis)